MPRVSRTDITRPRILEPGLLPYIPGTERYVSREGDPCILLVHAGDRVTITDREGNQRCEVTALKPSGAVDLGILDLKVSCKADAFDVAAVVRGKSSEVFLSASKIAGADLRSMDAAVFFGDGSKSKETVTFTAEEAGLCLILAPGKPMEVDKQTPPTDIDITVLRHNIDNEIEMPLPVPLADPRLDFRIERATALAYEVKAGEFLQVIDVSGRQCSDFLAFHREALDKGEESGLDAVTTRTLMGNAYPGPGLFSKFFDQKMQPLVEIGRDTVGRHDTFSLACTAKYYEEMGYPGHANCSENFNGVLADYDIVPRKGWPAINFFYNTAVDQNDTLVFDESWSRPGDYVLLRAVTDLVCASSACPDDIDGANAWNPSDVHVRVYPKTNIFSKAIAYRMTPGSQPQLTRETAFHPRISLLTRNFTEYRGFWLPTSFKNHGVIEEYYACREHAVVMDLSPLRKFEVLGPDAEELLQHTLTRNVRKVAVGQVSYTAMCNETGGMLDDGTIFRLGADNFRWICGDDYSGIWLREKAAEMGLRAWVKSSTDQLHNIAIQGPKSRDILRQVIWSAPTQPSLDELAWFRFLIGRIGDYNGIPILLSRTGYTGELGYELWCHPKDAIAVWDSIWEVGKPLGLTPIGLEALDVLRIEAGLVFAGYEFDDQIDPFEAGIGFTVALKSKEAEDFIGKETLIRRKNHPNRTLVGLELEGNEIAIHGDCVHIGRSQVGVITSGARSPILRKNIALCRIAIEHSSVGNEVEVGKMDGHQKRIPATIVSFPFYDPEKKRVRS